MDKKHIASLSSFIFGFILCAVLTADGIVPVGESGSGWSLVPLGVLVIFLNIDNK